MHRDLYQLAFTCWAKEKEERYTAAQLLERLTAKLEEENAFHGTVGWLFAHHRIISHFMFKSPSRLCRNGRCEMWD